MFKFFHDVTNTAELRKAFRELVLKHHPDCGGDEETMKAINAEYEVLFERLKNAENRQSWDERSQQWSKGKQENKKEYQSKRFEDLDDGFREVLIKIINVPNIIIEIVGSWIWIGGKEEDTKAAKGFLKEAGFKSSFPEIMTSILL